MLRRFGVLAAVGLALAIAPAASGDGGSPNYRSMLTSVAPQVKGLSVRVVDGDDAIELRNRTGLNVLVPGYENEPYLRFLTNGRVEVNVNSPAKYLNEERYGGVTVPKEASADAKPEWQLVAQGGAFTWHEHRVHWMSTDRPPQVKDAGSLTKIFDWVVPLGIGGKRVKVSGTLWWIPTGQLKRANALIAAAVAKEAQEKQAEASEKTTAAPASEEQAAPAAAPEPAASDSGAPVLWILIAALVAAFLGAAAYALRLRRRGDTGGRAGEAW